MIRKLITEVHTFIGGIIKDIQNVGVPKNKYIDAENTKLTDPTSDTLGAITTTRGNELAFDLGELDFASDSDDYLGVRIIFDTTSAGINHTFSFPTPFVISSALGTPILRYNDLVTKFIAQIFFPYSAAKYIDDPSPTVGGLKYVGFKIFGYAFDPGPEIIGATDYTIETLKPFYGTSKNGAFIPLKTLNIGEDLYVISTNGSIFRLGVGKKDILTSSWTYNVMFESDNIVVATDMINLFDLDGYIGFNDRVQLYYTGLDYRPRVTYFYHLDVWEDMYAFIWNENPAYIVTGNPNGIYLFSTAEEETRLQLLENLAHLPCYDEIVSFPSYAPVVQAGGSLTAGDKMYTVRQLITDTASTAWGLISNPIPIFSDSLSDFNLKGDITGGLTNKSIVLTILNLNPDLYNKFQVAVVENNDGVLTAKIIGTFILTSETETITHIGTEQTISLSMEELIQQQIAIKEAGNLVLNRNRLFLSRVKLSIDPDIAQAVLDGTTYTTKTITLPVAQPNASVGEYQVPGNVYATTGYMINEKYRFGSIFALTDGRIIGPYSNGDWTCTATTSASPLTDNPGGTPANILVYYPEIRVDYTGFPDVDGVPFSDAVYAVMHVRLECIPEVLATGLAFTGDLGYESAGVYRLIANGEVTGKAASNPTNFFGGLLYPDVLFSDTEISYTQSVSIRNFGQPYSFSDTVDSRVDGIHTDFCAFREFAGTFASPSIAPLLLSELVPAFSNGIVPFNPFGIFPNSFFSSIFRTDYPAGANFTGNGNQKMIAFQVDNPGLSSLTAYTEYRARYTQAFISLPDKYGENSQGRYISCGHFKVIGSTTSVCNVFGGDTFTQNNILKYSNYRNDGVNDYWRQGISFYSQNRVNTQMRYFRGDETNPNFPYQTTSLVDWLSGVTTALAQDDPGQILYSDSYTPINNVQQIQVFDPTLSVDATLDETMYYSELTINNSTQDPNRYFLPLNSKSYAGIYGPITNTFRDNNAILILMQNVVLRQELDQQQIEIDPTAATSLILGNGTVMGARESIESNFGSPFKTGAINYLTRWGIFFTIWWSHYFKKMMRKGPDGIKDIGLEHGMQSWFLENMSFINQEHEINIGYDMYSSETIISTNADVPDSAEWNPVALGYTQGDIVWVNNDFGIKIYYRARRNMTGSRNPALLYNRFQYWERYRNSNFTLTVNEKTGSFGQFYTYRTRLLASYKDNYLTFDDDHSIWEHNRGDYYSWYGVQNGQPFITYVLNYEPDEFKSMRNIWVRCDNQPLYGFAVGINGTRTYLEQSDFQQKGDRRYWWANIKNDATLNGPYLGGTNTTGINTLPTRRITGETIEVTIFFEGQNKVNETKNTYTIRPRSPST